LLVGRNLAQAAIGEAEQGDAEDEGEHCRENALR
jgi:hypothetical protein